MTRLSDQVVFQEISPKQEHRRYVQSNHCHFCQGTQVAAA